MKTRRSAVPADLQGLQQWFQAAITRPWETDEAQLRLVIREGEGELVPAARLGIYTRAYQGRLVECMESEFPVLRLALGKELFARFASEYLMTYPSHSYTLTALGKRFPRYLRETRPEAEDELWPEFVIELAALERLFSEVFHGDGPEGTGEPAAIDTETIAREPWTRWMRCRFPVDEYFVAARRHLKEEEGSEEPGFPGPESVGLLVFRRDYVVQLRRIPVDDLPPPQTATT